MTVERAAQIAQTRGSGDAVSDWLLAERELDINFRRRRGYRTKLAYREGSQRAKATERERPPLATSAGEQLTGRPASAPR